MNKIILLFLFGFFMLFSISVFADDSGILYKSQDGHLIFGDEATATQNLPLGSVNSIVDANRVCSSALIYAASASRSGCLPLTAISFPASDGKNHFACNIPTSPNFISPTDSSCAKGLTITTTNQPKVNSIEPSSVQLDKNTPGFNLTINGKGFGESKGIGGVSILGIGNNNSSTFLNAAIQNWSDEQIQAYIRPRATLPNGDTQWQVTVLLNEPKFLIAPQTLVVTSNQESHTFSVNQGVAADQPKVTPQIYIGGSALFSNSNLNVFTAEDVKKIQVKLSVSGQSSAKCEYPGENQTTYNIVVSPVNGGSESSQSISLCQDASFTLLKSSSYKIGLTYHGDEYSWTFSVKPSSGQNSTQTDSNVIAAKDISDLYQIINGGCHTTGNSCVTTVKNDCFGANGIDTTKFDAKTGDTTFLTNKFQNSAQAITAAGLCIQYYNFGKFKTAANSGLVLHIYKDDNKNCYTELVPSSDNIFDSSLICGAGVYSFYLVQKSTDKTLKAFKVNYQLSTSGGASGNNPKVLNCTGDCSKCPSDQVEATVQFGSEQPYGACTPLSSCPSGQQQCQQGGNAGSSGSSGSSGANGGSGSTTVTSCTGRCSVCQSGYVEGTITMADNSTHGECVLRSSCPAGQQDCKDNQDATQNAPSCNFSQSCGNGGTQVCPGKYQDGQCRYVAGSTCDPCKGEVGTPNRICSPGAYDVSCTGSCGPCGRGSGRGEAKVQQCNSSGTGWDGRNNECNGKCATYCGSAVPTGGCSYPESIDRSICGSGVHVCDGKYDNGVCKYDPGTSTNCRCA